MKYIKLNTRSYQVIKFLVKIIFLTNMSLLFCVYAESQKAMHISKPRALVTNKVLVLEAIYYSRFGWSRACNASDLIRDYCRDTITCGIYASDGLCGDPQPSVNKVLRVKYACDPYRNIVKVASVGQGGTVWLDCSMYYSKP